ncbi:MAG: hypothetical protein AAGF44_02385 [Pseudomonadota bacterium]
MHLRTVPALLLMLSLSLAAAPEPAIAQEDRIESAESEVTRLLMRLANQYAVLFLRSAVDLTYDTLSISPNSFDTVVTGLTLYPLLDWDEEGECVIEIDRLSSGALYSFDLSSSVFELNGISVPRACFQPEQGALLLGMGYDGFKTDTMAIETTYDLPSSAAEIVLTADIAEAVDLTLEARFDYLWIHLPFDVPGAEPEPVALLGSLEIGLENRGLWERMDPILTAQIGDLNALPAMAEGMLIQGLAGVSGTQAGPETIALASDLSAELTRFLAEKNRLVIRAEPPGGLWLDADLFTDPNALIAALQPEVSSLPGAIGALVPPADLAAALAGGEIDPALRLRAGEALVTGLGAPRSIEDGATVLAPLIQAWDGPASALLGEARAAEGSDVRAYNLALRAMASPDPEARSAGISLADRIEPKLPLAGILAAQLEASEIWPAGDDLDTADAELLAQADIAALRQRAYDAALGSGMPRSYRQAYLWASLAAAAGDRSAATLRDRLDRRFAPSGGALWSELAAEAGREAARLWSEEGLAERILARFPQP